MPISASSKRTVARLSLQPSAQICASRFWASCERLAVRFPCSALSLGKLSPRTRRCFAARQSLLVSTTTRGRPSFFPFARAFLSAAFTRSTINERSNSATAPNPVNTILPDRRRCVHAFDEAHKLDAERSLSLDRFSSRTAYPAANAGLVAVAGSLRWP